MPGPFLNTGQWKTRITDVASTAVEELGAIRFDSGKVLRYVKAGALIPAGEAVRIDSSVTTAGLFGNQVLQISAPTNIVAGIAEVTMASLNFGWMTVYGNATARVLSTAGAGAPLSPGTLTGVLNTDATSAFTANVVALAAGLSAGSAVFITAL